MEWHGATYPLRHFFHLMDIIVWLVALDFLQIKIKHTPSFPTFIQSLFGQEWKKIQTRWTLNKPLTNCVSFSVTYMRYGGSLSMVAEGIFTKIGKRFGVQKNWAIRQKRTNPLASIITILSGWAVGVSNQSPKRKVFRVPWIKPLLSFGEAGSLQGIAC